MSTANAIPLKRNLQDFGHIKSLDGLRGFAVLMVFTYHVFHNMIPPGGPKKALFIKLVTSGWIGVDLFFVLSGFLITTILLDAKSSTNYYKVFYIRRGLRIFPLYYAVVAASLLLEPGHYSWKAQIFYWLNLSNLPTAFRPYLIGYLAHLWSLGIEEQFYMVWPAVIRKLRVRTVVKLCVGVIVALFLARNLPVMFRWNSEWPELIYRLTPFRIDTLCGGALLAILVKYRTGLVQNHRNLLRGMFVVSLGLFLVSGQIYTERHVIRFGYTSLVVCFVSLVALALFPGGFVSELFSNSFLRKLGKYSYSFYLFHPYVVNYVGGHRDLITRAFHVGGPVMISTTLATMLAYPVEFMAIFGLSMLSWSAFEGPILKLKRHFRYEPKPDHYLA